MELRFTFRRTVNSRLMNQWYELEQIASSINFTDEPDNAIWQLNSMGRYSVQSLYAVVNDRGVRQVFTPVVWKIVIPHFEIAETKPPYVCPGCFIHTYSNNMINRFHVR
jgi:hypothetical protein